MRITPVRLSAFACIALLSACNNVGRNYIETVRTLVAERADVELAEAQADALGFPATYLRIDDGPQVLAVLALSEGGEFKWITSDRNLVTFRGGRLTGVIGPGFGPLYTSNAERDPLRDPRSIGPSTRWTRQMDWQVGDDVLANYTVESTYSVDTNARKVIGHTERTLTRVRETSRVVQTGVEYTDEFWVDPADGAVLASRQHALPAMVPIEITSLASSPRSTPGVTAVADPR